MKAGPAEILWQLLISCRKISQTSWSPKESLRIPQHRSTTWTGSDLADQRAGTARTVHALYTSYYQFLGSFLLRAWIFTFHNWPQTPSPDCDRKQGPLGKLSPAGLSSRCSYLTGGDNKLQAKSLGRDFDTVLHNKNLQKYVKYFFYLSWLQKISW